MIWIFRQSSSISRIAYYGARFPLAKCEDVWVWWKTLRARYVVREFLVSPGTEWRRAKRKTIVKCWLRMKNIIYFYVCGVEYVCVSVCVCVRWIYSTSVLDHKITVTKRQYWDPSKLSMPDVQWIGPCIAFPIEPVSDGLPLHFIYINIRNIPPQFVWKMDGKWYQQCHHNASDSNVL